MDWMKYWPMIAFLFGTFVGAVGWAAKTDKTVEFLSASRGEIYERINAIEWSRATEGRR